TMPRNGPNCGSEAGDGLARSSGRSRLGRSGAPGNRPAKPASVLMADERLKIAVDGRELIGKPTGVGRYLLEILRAWNVSGFPHRVMVVTPSTPPPALIAELPDIGWHVEAARGAGTRW